MSACASSIDAGTATRGSPASSIDGHAPGVGRTGWQALLDAKLAGIDERLLSIPEGRRLLTRLDPLLFALVYLPDDLRGKDGLNEGQISFGEFHLDLVEQAVSWVVPNDEAERDGYIAPRESGKSTWLFKILPTWAAAHGHRRFIAAFADAGGQATTHLANFRRELDSNVLLQTDYPGLTTSAGTDNKNLYLAQSGFIFYAKGIDAASLGLLIDGRRPDLLILDDIEKGSGKNTLHQKQVRLKTIRNDIFYLAKNARVIIAGTVTMPGSIIHDLVKAADDVADTPPWVIDEDIRVHHYRALITDDATGEQRSMWPDRWTLPELVDQAHMREFRMQMQNDPMAADGEYWTDDDFTHGELPDLTNQILSIDPAVTSNAKSDYTALAVIGFSKTRRRCVVRGAWQVRLQPGEQLRAQISRILVRYPDIRAILVETNQGGDVWQSILAPLGLRVVTKHQSEPKEVRAARLLNHYQRGRVLHERAIPALEEQMIAFPKGAHDDLVDAVGTGIEQFLRPPTRVGKASMSSHDYVRNDRS